MDKRDGPHLSQVHKINHAVYICDRMGRSKDLTEFECDTMKVFPSLLFQDQLLVVLLQRGSIWDTQQLSHEVADQAKLQSGVAECVKINNTLFCQ